MKNTTQNELRDLSEDRIRSEHIPERNPTSSNSKIEHITERWNHLKKEETLSELDQILQFSQEPESSLLKNSRVCREMELLLFELRENKWGKFYYRVVDIIEKYLRGIRKFLSGSGTQEIPFYKQLFEGTMIAIIEEVSAIEDVPSSRVFG